MSSKAKAILSFILFIALLGGLKLFYDNHSGNTVISGLEGNPSATAAGSAGNNGLTQGAATQLTAGGESGNRPGNTLPLPDITVFDGAGTPVQLSSFRGKKLVVNVWASWCGPCKAEMPDFMELDQEASNYQIVMVNIPGGLETRENSDKFLKDNNLVFTNMMYDKSLELVKALEITSIPTSIFVDAQGNIHYYQQGTLTRMQVLDALATIE